MTNLETKQAKEIQNMRQFIDDLRHTVANSEGVVGWHMNGDVARWSEFGYDEIEFEPAEYRLDNE